MYELFEKLPNNLHLARNDNAPEFDRWRIYNISNGKYLEETGAETAIECMKKLIAIEERQRKEWGIK